MAANYELLDMPGCKEVSCGWKAGLGLTYHPIPGQCGQLSDQLEDLSVPGAQGE